ncbi:MAG: Ig-like domain-containing protein [Verrucomicrobiales bacterium]
MKSTLHNLFATSAVAAMAVATAQGDLIVYEGFDYTVGDAIWTQDSGTGWDGAWTGTDTDTRGTPEVGNGLALGALLSSGGSYLRPQRYGVAQSSRTISSASQAALTADDSTIWFSVLMKANVGGSTGGFAANSHGAIVIGDAAFTTANPGSTPPTIETGGNAVGVSFDGDSGNAAAAVGITGVTYVAGTRTQVLDDEITVGDTTVMIVGQINWAANGTNDVISLYNVTDPSAALPAAFTTMEVDLDQSTFNVVATAQGQTEIFDEIRFGESYADVTPLDTTPPAIVSLSPENGATDVAINQNLRITFDESIALGTTGDVTITNLTDSSEIVISLPDSDEDGTITATSEYLLINPTANLDLGATYAVQIGATVVTDLGGNPFAGISDTTTWSFTTSATDTYPPSPDPMTFAVAPTAISDTEITMTATTATDDSGVEYLFSNTTRGTDSGWQSSTTWTETGLSPDTLYAYTVTARDTSTNQTETTASAEASAWTYPEITGNEILATVFAGRTITGSEAAINDFTLNGVDDPISLLADSVPGSTVTVNSLFDTPDTQNFFAPNTSSSSAHWQVDVPLDVDSEAISLGNIELYMQSFSSSGTRKLTHQNTYQDHWVTVELFDSTETSLGSEQIFGPDGSRQDYVATFTFGKGMELAANESYTLRILVSGEDPTTPANTGNYVGIDAIRVLNEADSASPFTLWQTANFPGETDEAIIGANADPDMDGISNLVEYGLNTDPNDGSDVPVTTAATDGEDLWIHYTQVDSATDIDYIVEWSTDLTSWFDTYISETTDPDPAVDADYPVIKASVGTAGDPALFMRVRIEQK